MIRLHGYATLVAAQTLGTLELSKTWSGFVYHLGAYLPFPESDDGVNILVVGRSASW